MTRLDALTCFQEEPASCNEHEPGSARSAHEDAIRSVVASIAQDHKLLRDGALEVCVNPDHDLWQRADSLPLDLLREIAERSQQAKQQPTTQAASSRDSD